MDALLFLYVGLAALLWGGYPILTRFAVISPQWMAIIMSLFAILIVSLGLFAKTPFPDAKSALIVSIAGLMMGGGFYFFANILTFENVELGKIVPIIFAVAPLVTAVGALIFLGEPFTVQKTLGLAAIGIGIYLLS